MRNLFRYLWESLEKKSEIKEKKIKEEENEPLKNDIISLDLQQNNKQEELKERLLLVRKRIFMIEKETSPNIEIEEIFSMKIIEKIIEKFRVDMNDLKSFDVLTRKEIYVSWLNEELDFFLKISKNF